MRYWPLTGPDSLPPPDISALLQAQAASIIESLKAETAHRLREQQLENLAYSGRLAAFVLGGQWKGASANTMALALGMLAVRGYQGLLASKEQEKRPELTAERVAAYVEARRRIRGLTSPVALAGASAALFTATQRVHECSTSQDRARG